MFILRHSCILIFIILYHSRKNTSLFTFQNIEKNIDCISVDLILLIIQFLNLNELFSLQYINWLFFWIVHNKNAIHTLRISDKCCVEMKYLMKNYYNIRNIYILKDAWSLYKKILCSDINLKRLKILHLHLNKMNYHKFSEFVLNFNISFNDLIKQKTNLHFNIKVQIKEKYIPLFYKLLGFFFNDLKISSTVYLKLKVSIRFVKKHKISELVLNSKSWQNFINENKQKRIQIRIYCRTHSLKLR